LNKEGVGQHIVKIIGLIGFALILGYAISQFQFVALSGVLALVFGIAFLYLAYRFEKLSLYFVLVMSFILPILGRYLPIGVPFGLSIDIILVLGLLIVFIKNYKHVDTNRLNNPIFWLMLAWMGYVVMQIFNPLAHSFAAWFYSMRGIALYQLLIIMLLFLTFDAKKDIKPFMYLWISFSVLGALWGMKQLFFGVSAAEQRWLDEGGAITHMLFGKLRVFSYYFDAGTFGAAMGHISLICGIILISPYFAKRTRIISGILALLFFYGLMISGTRGALAVPAAGGLMYLILTRNTRVLIPGLVAMALVFGFLKFTTIGQSNYQINRLRTALDPNDASLNTRIVNRERLSVYLQDKPFGGGLGTTGSWGNRFSPGTWLADFEPDGLYTRIRAETGIVGRLFYVGIWLFILGYCARLIFKAPDGKYKSLAMAFLAGYAGILLANYGNSVMSQFPISTTTFFSLYFVVALLEKADQEEERIEEES
jgi:O-antigen ligase